MSGRPTIAVIVPARNERRALPALLACIEGQTLRPDEVVISDGGSTDGTRQWLDSAADEHPWLRWIDNPAGHIPAALNQLLESTDAEIIVRMDAHATYAPDYLEHVVAVLETHPEVVAAGGSMDSVGEGPWGTAIASLLRWPWSMGGAPHRIGGTGGPVDHVFTPAYRRQAVVAVGGWDLRQLANEDAELDHRLREAGGVVWLETLARCTWTTRNTPGALSRQMWRYGFYRARTIWMHPESLRARHLAPPA